MQTNVTCSLPRKGQFPDQKLGVLLVVMYFPKWPSPRLKLHSFPSPPAGIYCRLVAGLGWLALLFPAGPLLVCPAFSFPGCLLSLGSPPSTTGLFLRRQTFWSLLCTSHFEQICRAQAAVLATRLSACRSMSDGAEISRAQAAVLAKHVFVHWIGWPDFQQAKVLLTGCKLDRTEFKIKNSFSTKQGKFFSILLVNLYMLRFL